LAESIYRAYYNMGCFCREERAESILMKKTLLLLCLVGVLLIAIAAQNASGATSATTSSGTTYHVSLDVAQPGQHSILGKPTLSAAFIDRVLSTAHSPAAGTGQDFYQLSLHYGIDDAWPLAFFHHESDYGTTGEARVTYSIGNSRCIATRPCIDQNRGGYAQMWNWTDGIVQWYTLLRNLYINTWGRSTVEQIIPKYAPNSDGNDEQGYINALVIDAAGFRAGEVLS
jgi:hypothetical protein